MDIQAETRAIETEAQQLGIAMAEVLEKAGNVHPETWRRWKTGAFLPQLRMWQRVTDAFGELKAEKITIPPAPSEAAR